MCRSASLLNDDDDDDTTLVKLSEAAAATSDAEQHLESQVADLQRCAVLCNIHKAWALSHIYVADRKRDHFFTFVSLYMVIYTVFQKRAAVLIFT